MPEQRTTAHFGGVLDACTVHACRVHVCLGRHWVQDLGQEGACARQAPGCPDHAAIEASEQGGWGLPGDARDASALGGALGTAASVHAVLGTWPKLALA